MMTVQFKQRLSQLKVYRMSLGDRYPRGSKYLGRTVEWACYDDPSYVVYCHENDLYKVDTRALNLAYDQLNKRREYGNAKNRASYWMD